MSGTNGSCTIELSGAFDMDVTDYIENVKVQEQVDESGVTRGTTLVVQTRDMEAFLGVLHFVVNRGHLVRSVEYRQFPPCS